METPDSPHVTYRIEPGTIIVGGRFGWPRNLTRVAPAGRFIGRLMAIIPLLFATIIPNPVQWEEETFSSGLAPTIHRLGLISG